MAHSPETRRTLLIRIKDAGDHQAWEEFVSIYAPLIHAYGVRRGLQDADAADVAQMVLQSIATAIPGFEYDPQKGSFRGWLFQITRNWVLKTVEKRGRTPTATGETSFHQKLSQQPGQSEDEDLWNREHEQQLFHWAADKVRLEFKENTWQAFWRVAVEGQPVADVAAELGMSAGAIYIAKSRVTARLREMIETVES